MPKHCASKWYGHTHKTILKSIISLYFSIHLGQTVYELNIYLNFIPFCFIRMQSLNLPQEILYIAFLEHLLLYFQYRATDLVVSGPGNFSLTFTPADGGNSTSISVFDFKESGGVILGMYNTDQVRLVVNLAFQCF